MNAAMSRMKMHKNDYTTEMKKRNPHSERKKNPVDHWSREILLCR